MIYLPPAIESDCFFGKEYPWNKGDVLLSPYFNAKRGGCVLLSYPKLILKYAEKGESIEK